MKQAGKKRESLAERRQRLTNQKKEPSDPVAHLIGWGIAFGVFLLCMYVSMYGRDQA